MSPVDRDWAGVGVEGVSTGELVPNGVLGTCALPQQPKGICFVLVPATRNPRTNFSPVAAHRAASPLFVSHVPIPVKALIKVEEGAPCRADSACK
jgi:hypothetical protein